ncbi:hypothetical protein M0R45_024016 [Rubus argutus]|uniref:Uncharacterized protein n=1 Tax=Rubus argutus TaxID=59490 RepID=A0AAW1WU26_RUBAR
MRRSSYDYTTKHQNGSDYYSHVNRMARAPSVLTDVPHHGALFNNNQVMRPGHYDQYQQQQHSPEPVRGVVEVTERVTQFDNNGNCMVMEETIDVESDGFIQEKHKGFELCKWRTFKAR